MFGPYLYETKRVNGKVVTSYIGKHVEKPWIKYKSLIVVIVLAVILLSSFFFPIDLTGKVFLDIETDYEVGEAIKGNLKLKILEGELIPQDTRVVVSLGDVEKEFLLFDLVSDLDLVEGDFYAENAEISGQGKGYGIPGEVEVFPEISFDLAILQDDLSSGGAEEVPVVEEESPAVEEPAEPVEEPTVVEKGVPLEPEEEVVEEKEEKEKKEKKEKKDEEPEESVEPEEHVEEVEPGITGAVVSDVGGEVISGVVRKGESFERNIGEGNDVSLLSGSLKIDGVVSEEKGLLKIKVSNLGDLSVSTDYSETREGFGGEFLSNKQLKINIPLELFEFIALEDSVLNVRLVYGDILIVESNGKVNVEDTLGNVNDTVVPIIPIIPINQTGINIIGNSSLNQSFARLGEPVIWTRTIDVTGPATVIVQIPASAVGVSVKKLDTKKIHDFEFDEEEVVTEEVLEEIVEESVEFKGGEKEVTATITGEVISGRVTADIRTRRSFFNRLREFFGITGLVTSNITGNESINFVAPEVVGEVQEIVVDINATEDKIEVSYETPAPYSIETERPEGKEVRVIGPDDVHYSNVLIFTNLSESLGIKGPESVRVYWREEGIFLPPTLVLDVDGNGIYDYVEWIAPSLSNQTFDIIIIIKAEHLDENRTFISDIFSDVRELDGNWSETIPEGHYVRIVFEKELNAGNDITVYPRTINGTPKIEIYERDQNTLIAEFTSISDNEYNKVFLSSLVGTQNAFDLRVLSGSVEFDHIIDPTLVPNITFVDPTPASGSSQTNTDIFVNLSSVDDSGDHYAFTDFDSDLLLWIRMDDVNSSGDPTDLSSYSNNGTLEGDALINSSSGYFGNGSHFDGNSDFINFSSDSSFDSIQNETTMSIWIKQVDGNGARRVFWSLYLNATELLTLDSINSAENGFRLVNDIDDVGQTENVYVGCTGIDLKDWTHVVMVFNSTDALGYHNGAACTPVALNAFLENLDDGFEVRIGFESQNSQVMNGSIDEFMIFNRSLTAGEISALYNATATQYANNFTGLAVGNHTFTGYAVDLAGNKNQTELRSVEVTGSIPIVSFVTPTPFSGDFVYEGDLLVNVTFSNADNVTLYLLNSTKDIINTSTSTTSPFFLNYTNQSSGIYFFNASAIDSENTVTNTNLRNVLVINPNSTGDGTVKSSFKINASRFGNGNELGGDNFGQSVANIGDLDGDGIQDLAVGEDGNDDGGINNGAVWIMFLNTNGSVKSEFKINESEFGNGNELNSNFFGSGVANIGDLDGDGIQDIAVGELSDDGGDASGAVWIMFLNTNGSVKSEYKINESRFGNGNELDGGWFGYSIANIGDLDGDGIQDIAVGEPVNGDGGINNGAVWIMFLNTNGSVKSEYKINESRFGNGNELSGDTFGVSVANLGDLDGDGVQDIAVGEYLSDDGCGGSDCDNGAVWIMFLNTNGSVKSEYKINESRFGNGNELSGDTFGVSVANIGDLDGDGIQDIAVGEYLNDDGRQDNGAVWIMFLNTNGSVKSEFKINESEFGNGDELNSNGFGNAVANLGDLDGDGIQDIAVGEYFNDDGESQNGAVWILSLNQTTSVAAADLFPNISFVAPTPASGSSQTNTDIFVNLSSVDDSGDHYAFTDFDSDLLLWMRMDDTNSSGDPIDLSSYGNNGTFGGDAKINSTGRFGNASHFDGTGDYIDVGSPDSLDNIEKEITVSAWMNPREVKTNMRLVSKWGSSGNRAWLLSTDDASANELSFAVFAGTNRICDSTATYSANSWTHVVGTWSNTSGCVIYVNTVSASLSGTGSLSVVNTPVRIGIEGGSDTSEFNGTIDEVIIFNRSLTAGEISVLYNATATQYENNFTGLTLGNHIFTGYAVDLAGNKNQTELRTVIISPNLVPNITFVDPTPANGTTQTNTDIFVNLSSVDDSGDHYAFTDFDRDLLLWMRMDDVNSSGDPIDLSSYSQNGTLAGSSAINGTSGFWGNGTFFAPDTTGFIEVHDIIMPSTAITASFWTKTSGDGEAMLSYAVSGSDNEFLIFDQDPLSLFIEGTQVDAGLAINNGKWQHIVITWDTVTDRARFYINGSLEANVSLVGTDITAGGCLAIGQESDSICGGYTANQALDGDLDEVLIWNRTLTGEEISALYNATATQYENNFTGLADGEHIFTGYAVDLAGNKNQTEDRSVTIDTLDTIIPNITFVSPTPANGTTHANTDIFVNLSTSDINNASNTVQHYAFTDFNNDLMLWMRFDDVNSSGDPIDLSSWSNNGSLVGNALINSTGYWGNASWYDGTGDYVKVDGSLATLIQGDNDFAVSFWANGAYQVNGAGVSLSTGSSDANKLLIIYPYDSFTDDGFRVWYSGASIIDENDGTRTGWNHFIFLSRNSTDHEMYVNGVSEGTSSVSKSLASDLDTISIGTWGSQDFLGGIDDVLIFNRSLTQTEISALYNATATQYENNFTNLANGEHTFTGYAVDLAGNINQTEDRSVTIDTTLDTIIPNITFVDPTPANGTTQTGTSIFVNLSSVDDSGDHYAFTDFDRDLLLWMRFDDTNSSGDPTDLSSYGNNGTFGGDAKINSTGRFGNASHFDGNGDFIRRSVYDSEFNFTEGTISMWLNPEVLVGSDAAITFGTIDTGGGGAVDVSWWINTGADNTLRFGISDLANINSSGDSAVSLGVWSHIVGLVNATNVCIFVNNVPTCAVKTINISTLSTFRLGIGRITSSAVNDFKGSIDEVIIFNRSLSIGEISALYNATATQYASNFTGLALGNHTFTGYAVDLAGNKNQTEDRSVEIVLPSTACEGPPLNENWVIQAGDDCSFENINLIMSTDANISVYGNLTFNSSVNLVMDPSSDGSANISVESGGKLNVTGNSKINSTTTSNEYWFNANSGSELYLSDSTFLDIGTLLAGSGCNRGMCLQTSNIIIQNNTISGGYGILRISAGADNVRVLYNSFTDWDQSPVGIGSIDNLTFSGNIFSDDVHSNFNLLSIDGNPFTNSLVSDNIFSPSSETSLINFGAIGFDTASAENITFRNNTFNQVSDSTTKVSFRINNPCTNCEFYDNKINNDGPGFRFNTDDPLLGFRAENNWFNTSTGNLQYINVTSAYTANVTFLNATGLDVNSVYVDNSSVGTISLAWYVDVNVTDSADASAISGAESVLYNVSDGLVFSETTAASGFITRQNVTTHVVNSTGFLDMNLHTLNVTASGYGDYGNNTINITTNMQIDVELNSTFGTIVWIANTEQLFTNVTAWDIGRIPIAGDDIILNGSGTGNMNIENNTLPQNLNSWNVSIDYTGTVRFEPLFAVGSWGSNAVGSQEWNVTNNINILSGTMKIYGDGYNHTINGMQNVTINGHGQIWHSLNGNITIGSSATLNGIGLGFPRGAGPGTSGAGQAADHGGGSNEYGNEVMPTALGSGSTDSAGNGVGGSAIKLESSEEIIIDGTIDMRAGGSSKHQGSGGSILVIANNISGSGSLEVKGGSVTSNQNRRAGAGGRIALISTGNIILSGLVSAMGGREKCCGGSSPERDHGDGGTIYINATTSITLSGNVTTVGDDGGYINITGSLLDLSGVFNSTFYNSTSDLINGNITTNYTDCSSTFTGTFNPARIDQGPGCDTTSPEVTINFPVGGANYSASDLPLNFNVTLSENGTVMYSLDNGVNNISMMGDQDPYGTAFNYTNSSIADGTYTFSVYANDTAGNNNFSESVSFTYDSTDPVLASYDVDPSNGTNYSSGQLYLFNVTATDTNLNTVWIDWDGTNFTSEVLSLGSDIYQFNRTDLGAGTFLYIWYANDSSGNEIGSGTRYYTIEKAASNLTTHINHTRANITNLEAGLQLIDVNVTLIAGSGTINLTIDGSLVNVGTSQIYNATNFTTISSGIAVNGSYDGNANFTASSEQWFVQVIAPIVIDTESPNLTINFPTAITYGSSDLPLNFNVTLSENGTVMYSLDNGVNNISMMGDQDPYGTAFNYTNSSIADGTYTFSAYGNDTSGNNNFSESVSFVVDTSSPASPSASPSGGGGGGGGGPSTFVSRIGGLILITPEEISINVVVGKVETREITIENTGGESVALTIDVENLGDVLNIQESVIVRAGEKKVIEFRVGPVEEELQAGKILFSLNGEVISEHLTVINVRSENFLFDSLITIPEEFKTIYLGDKLKAQVNLLQVGPKEKVDVVANYIIKDFFGNTYLEESETFFVLEEKEFIKELSTFDLPKGKYILGLEIVYPGAFAISSSQFEVVEKGGLSIPLVVGIIIIVLVLILIVLALRVRKV